MGQCNLGSAEPRNTQQFLSEEGLEGSALHPNTLNHHPSHSAPIHGQARSKYSSAIRKACRIGPLTAQKSLTRSTGQQRVRTVIQPGCREDAGCCSSQHQRWWDGGRRSLTGTVESDFLLSSAGLHLTMIHVCFPAEPFLLLVLGNKASQ